MEEPVHYLVLLLLTFDGTMYKEVLEFTRPMTLMECSDFAEAHKKAIATFSWDDPRGSSWFLNNGNGTWQGHICMQDPDKL